MILKRFVAENFRNIEKCDINFRCGVNLLHGDNAQGKTNAVEGIYLFSRGKSFRAREDSELIRFGKEGFRIYIEYEDKNKKGSFEYALFGKERLRKKNGYKVSKISEMIGDFKAVLFYPDDLTLVKGGPEERRRFVDISISQISPRFVHCLNDYARLLAQKNAILKDGARGGRVDKDYLAVINEGLAEASSVIVRQRAGFCEKLYGHAQRIYGEISDDKELLGMRYVSQTRRDFSDTEYTKNAYLALYDKYYESDLKNGVSGVGPHRDDIYFYVGKSMELTEELSADDLFDSSHTARAFGSRGQQRSVVLSLKLAQGELFKELCGEYPVFLLDDVFSELDFARRDYILKGSSDRQVIITCCDCDILGSFRGYNRIFVENGKYTAKGNS
jgi:DNA replication and repair protein RecF